MGHSRTSTVMTTTANGTSAAPGRIETLTPDQERVLKEVWMYYLHFHGFPITPSSPNTANGGHLSRSATRKNTITSIETNGSQKKKGGLMGKFKKGHSKKKSTEKLEKSLPQLSATDPCVLLKTDISVHEHLKGLKPDDLRESFWKFLRHDTPDNLLLRFVRARKWDVDNSLLMIAKTLKWRHYETHVDKLLFDGELGLAQAKREGVLKQFRSGICYIRGHDKMGRPVVYIRPRFHEPKTTSQEDVQAFTLLVIEYARLLITEPIDSCSVLFDLTGFTMASMDYAAVKFIIGAFEAHYPESLGVLFIHKAPWLFSGIWNIVKNWLDPVVASKIVFTKNIDDLNKVIDLEHIPASLGGKDTFEWKYEEPTEATSGLAFTDKEEQAAIEKERSELVDQFTQATIKWIESSTKEESQKYLEEKIALGKKLSENYIKLDGYIRNRSIYDKLGFITFQ
ncbi:unnamed protein product [Ambrosiozyma monospora]|uniref:Unnamed protein product n=1 Tax=Ambrosiozyma monospora TaxID=43982 RepID=A0ACB5SRE4_AMBMO|nr:unnamed protein product [Ambrosiozyma monospora]